MHDLLSTTAVSPLHQRLIDDMTLRRFSQETQRNYVRDVGRLATFLGRQPDMATAEDLWRFHRGRPTTMYYEVYLHIFQSGPGGRPASGRSRIWRRLLTFYVR